MMARIKAPHLLTGAVVLGLAGFALYCRLFTNLAIPGWTSNVLVESFFGAVNALGISMLGAYVARIYDQVRQRPLYLVERSVNTDHRGETAFARMSAGSDTAVYDRLLQESSALAEMVEASAYAGELPATD